MQFMLNGEAIEVGLDEPATVQSLLEARQLSGAPCAVEVNAQLIPRQQHREHTLHNGDQIEIVTLVGGG